MLILKNGEYVVDDELILRNPNIDINSVKEEKFLMITQKRDELIQFGFESNGVKYGFNATDQQNMLETLTLLNTKLLLGTPNPTVFYKPYGVGTMKEYTAQEFLDVVNAAESHKTSIWNTYNKLLLEVDKATTIEEVEKVVWA